MRQLDVGVIVFVNYCSIGARPSAESSRQRNEWKAGSFGWNATAAPPELVSLGMANQAPPNQRQVNMITAVSLDTDRVLYALQTDAIGGLFEYTISRDEERRRREKGAS